MPPVSARAFLDKLAKAKPVPAVLLRGGEAYLRDACRKALIEKLVPAEAREWGVTRFSADEDAIDDILGRARSQPMFAACQVIVVGELEAWEKLAEEKREKLVDALNEYLDDPAPFTTLVLEAEKLDDRMKLAKLLAAQTLVVSAELGGKEEERAALAATLAVKMAENLGVKLEEEAALELAECTAGDLARIESELAKLSTYAGERKQITRMDVEALVVAAKKYSVWQLADVLAGRQSRRALEYLDSVLREGEQAPAIVGALAWMYRKLLEAKDLPPGTDKWRAVNVLRVREGTAELALAQAPRFSRERLVAGIGALYEADNLLKSGRDDRSVLEFLVVQLTGTEQIRTGTAAR